MNEHQYLERLEKLMSSENLDCALLDKTDEIPYDRLLIYLGNDYKMRERVMEITLQEQEFGESLKKQPEKKSYLRIQFQVPLSFQIRELFTQQVASLLLFLNRYLELPGLEMSEVDSKIFYRYVLLTDADAFDNKICLAIVGFITLILEVFTETIEKIADGSKTFNELLEDVIKITKEIEKRH